MSDPPPALFATTRSRLEAVIDTAVDGVILIDGEGRIRMYNPACEKLFGYAREEVMGENVRMLMPEPYRGEHDGYLEAYRRTGEAKIIGIGREVTGRRKDGTEFPMELSVGEAGEGDERVFVGIIRDITARKNAEQALRDSEGKLRAVIDTAVDGVIIIDAVGDIEMFNPACRRLFGYQPEEVIGRNVKMLMPDPYRSEHDGYLEAYRRTGEAKIIGIGREVTARRKNGTEFPMELSVAEAREGDEQIFVGIIRDITERKKAERELAESAHELEAFAYSVAHDLKAPLRAISGFSDALAEDYESVLDDAGREFLGHISTGAVRMGQLIDDLLGYSRLGRGGIAFRVLSLAGVVNLVRENLAAEIAASGAEILVEGDLPKVEAQQEIMMQIMQNLIGNALKFVAQGTTPRVTIRGGERDGHCTIEVTDNGIGMKPEYLSRIFEIFQRLHLVEDYPGTGIGLAIVKKGVQIHHGTIDVVSAPGDGTTFKLSFPARQPREDEE
ncbi:MAG: PAS domain S-box protein [Alphaproteobacteria bacterium]|nr:PAS domain S-box protein [Alphaproteobacteria bacterium]